MSPSRLKHLRVSMESSGFSGILEIYRAAQAYGDVDDAPELPSTIESELHPRSLEETHMIILERDAASRASNARYRCKYCSKEFMGGPQKIRVHLSGQRENATRLAKCPSVPADVKDLMVLRMRPRNKHRDMKISSEDTLEDESEVSITSSTPLLPSTQPQPPALTSMDFLPLSVPIDGLARHNREEEHVIVMSRCHNASPTFMPLPPPSSSPSPTNKRKSYNSQYQCKYCQLVFVGGPQKIRVHISGMPEGSTRIIRCERAPTQARENIQVIRSKMVNQTRTSKKRGRRNEGSNEGSENKSTKKMTVLDTKDLNTNLEILGLL
ncbi:hypothetical protein EON63_03475 [archaeon]|nr:MAG: hypothetical protein EON63_03475 [archaeon]